MRKIVFDVETKNSFQEVGSTDPAALDISLLVIYDYTTDTYQSFMEADFPKLWRILEQTDLIIGYNCDHFDIPVLNKYYPGDLTNIKTLDLLVEIKNALGKRVRLDAIAEATLGTNKTGGGLDAIKWWRQGEIEKIRSYCEMDVKITKEVYEYALKHQSLKLKDFDGIKTFPIKTAHWEKAAGKGALNYTLPF